MSWCNTHYTYGLSLQASWVCLWNISCSVVQLNCGNTKKLQAILQQRCCGLRRKIENLYFSDLYYCMTHGVY